MFVNVHASQKEGTGLLHLSLTLPLRGDEVMKP